MELPLIGKVAIVTGAGSGIGREIAVALAGAGASVIAVGRRRDALDATVALVPKQCGICLARTADVTQPGEMDAIVRDVVEMFGHLDILVNNAGLFSAIGALWEVDAEAWWQDVTTNLRGTMLATRAALGPMLEQNSGIVINLDGGGGGSGANPGASGYGASKAAIVRLTETLARELESEGKDIMVVAINPGLVRTSMTEALVDDQRKQRWQSFVSDAFAAGRTRPAEDCAGAILRLLAAATPTLNGRVFTVDDNFAELGSTPVSTKDADWGRMRLRERP